MRNLPVAGAIALVALLCGVVDARAQEPPVNDRFEHATVVDSLPAEIDVVYDGATVDPSEPVPCWSPYVYSTVWYRYTAVESGVLVIDGGESAPEGDSAPAAALYTGTDPSDLAEVGCGWAGRRLQAFDVVAGETYHLLLDGFAGRETLRLYLAQRPPNDDREAAVEIDMPTDLVTTNFLARWNGAVEPAGCAIGSTIWYRYRPTVTAPVVVSTSGSEIDTAIGIIRPGDPETGAHFGPTLCNDDGPGMGKQSEVGFLAEAGKTYDIQVGGEYDAWGTIALQLRVGAWDSTWVGSVANVTVSRSATTDGGGAASAGLEVERLGSGDISARVERRSSGQTVICHGAGLGRRCVEQ